MTFQSRRLLVAGLAALVLQAGAAWAGPEDTPPLPKVPPVGGNGPEIPPPPCSGGGDPTIPAACRPPPQPRCCCVSYDKAVRCPSLWPELTPLRPDPPPPGPSPKSNPGP